MEEAEPDDTEVLPQPNVADPATTLAIPPPATEMGAVSEAEDVFVQIERLGDLNAKGLITDEEFQAKKTEMLERL